MRDSRKRLLRMRATSIFGLEREFDLLGGCITLYNVSPYTHGPNKLIVFRVRNETKLYYLAIHKAICRSTPKTARPDALSVLTEQEEVAGSSLKKAEGQHLNMKKLTALIEFIMPIYNETKLECMYDNQ